jgi:hypothetical protein
VTLSGRAAAAGLKVLAEARWPAEAGAVLTPIPGFVVSSFSPLVSEVADRCLRDHHGDAPVDPAHGERTAIVVASVNGDVGTAFAVANAIDNGTRVYPLLFFQSVPNSIAGHIAAKWGLAGPVVCTSPSGDPIDDLLDSAALLFDDGAATNALLVLADSGLDDTTDGTAVAALVTPSDNMFCR